MGINTKESTKMESFLAKASTLGPTVRAMKGSSSMESGKAREAGNQLKTMETSTLESMRPIKRTVMEGTSGPMAASMRAPFPTMSSKLSSI